MLRWIPAGCLRRHAVPVADCTESPRGRAAKPGEEPCSDATSCCTLWAVWRKVSVQFIPEETKSPLKGPKPTLCQFYRIFKMVDFSLDRAIVVRSGADGACGVLRHSRHRSCRAFRTKMAGSRQGGPRIADGQTAGRRHSRALSERSLQFQSSHGGPILIRLEGHFRPPGLCNRPLRAGCGSAAEVLVIWRAKGLRFGVACG